MIYLVKMPWLVKKIYPSCIWDLPTTEKKIYLSFDDGPHEIATPFVLDQLAKYQAKATFFCLGKNVLRFPEIYKRILLEGHRVGNHTQNHMNGRRVKDSEYFKDIEEAKKWIDSNLFRPPYGRISSVQTDCLKKAGFKIVMWDVLSADFDTSKTGENCAHNVKKLARKGSIVVFHDSQKAWDRLKIAVPDVLDFFSENKYQFDMIG